MDSSSIRQPHARSRDFSCRKESDLKIAKPFAGENQGALFPLRVGDERHLCHLALGLPIVASDLASIREVLTDGRTALLVPPGDAPALGRAMTRLAGDTALSAALGAAGRTLANDYTWERRAERLEAALDAAARA